MLTLMMNTRVFITGLLNSFSPRRVQLNIYYLSGNKPLPLETTHISPCHLLVPASFIKVMSLTHYPTSY